MQAASPASAAPGAGVVIVSGARQAGMTQVLVAQKDLPAGTRLAMGDLTWQPWPADSVNPAFITDGRAELPATNAAVAVANKAAAAATQAVAGGPMEAASGSIVRIPILANEPVTQAKLVRGGEGGYMAVVLNPGMRAVAVPVSVTSAAGGFVLPGDRVDVLQGRPADPSGGGHPGFVAETLLRNIRVLAIDQTSDAKTVQSMVGAVATLEVAAQDAEILVKAKSQGDMVLALRPYADANQPSGRGISDPGATGDVRIFRNGQLSDVTVTP